MKTPIQGNGYSVWTNRYGVVNVKDYGAVGDGVADDTAAIKDAITAAEAISTSVMAGATVDLVGSTYNITSGITVDCSKIRIIGHGATLDFSSTSGITCLTITGSINPPYTQNFNGIYGVEIKGPGRSNSGSVGLYLNASSGPQGPSHLYMDAINISYFETGVKLGDNAYILDFDHCEVWQCSTCVSSPSGTSNTGERIVFQACSLFNSTTLVVNADINTDLYFIGCSLDSFSRVATCSGRGSIRIIGCHLEGSEDSDYWLYVSGVGSIIEVSDSTLIETTVTRGNYEIGYSDSTVSLGGLALRNISFVFFGYDLQRFIAGTGRCVVEGLTQLIASMPNIGSASNLLAYGDFESASSLSDWVLGGNDDPTLDNTKGHNGSTQSMKFAVTATGNTSQAYRDFPIKPGQRPLVSTWYQASGLTASGDSFTIEVQYLDVASNVLETVVSQVISADASSWTLSDIKVGGVAKPGSVNVRVKMTTGAWATSNAAWVDDFAIDIV